MWCVYSFTSVQHLCVVYVPWATREALPAFFCQVTACSRCPRHFLQKVFFFLGKLTCGARGRRDYKRECKFYRCMPRINGDTYGLGTFWMKMSPTRSKVGMGDIDAVLLECVKDVLSQYTRPIESIRTRAYYCKAQINLHYTYHHHITFYKESCNVEGTIPHRHNARYHTHISRRVVVIIRNHLNQYASASRARFLCMTYTM